MPIRFKNLAKKYILLKKGWSPQQNLFYGFITYILIGCFLLCLPLFQKNSATFLITLTNTFNFEEILFEVASALGTVGVSTGITADLDTFGKVVIIILMFIGRLGVLTFGLAIWSKSISNNERQVLKDDIAV